jgi:glycosyltransferase involved in cell wall biosynthesis
LASERTDISDWLASVDVLALSSAWGEAFPNVLGEAMACGIPCVTTSVGDSAWILDKGGIAVRPQDEAAMAQALANLAGMGPEGRRKIGAAGRARVVEHFAIESVGHQYRRLYEQLLTGPVQMASRDAPIAALFQARPR